MSDKLKLKKGKEIQFEKFEISPYLHSSSRLTIETMRQIYHIQTREIYLKGNFPSQFSDTKCVVPQCSGRDENLHIFSCSYLSPQNEVMSESSFVTYYDIFLNNTHLQQTVATIIFSRLEVRKEYLGP